VSLRQTTPVKFSPAGVSDTLDGSNVFPGAMQALTNLIPDVTTKNVWTCRPAAISHTTFASYTTPGFISVIKVVGTRVYGMISSGRNAGKDEPFIFDMVAGAFVTISNITNANTPTSPAVSGAWVPPTMDLVGSKMVVTHPGYTGGGGMFFGWFDISTFASPAWDAGNTATNALPTPPTNVKQFGQRAWFVCNSASSAATYFTDILDPLTITNANQILTYDDNTPITALGALPLNTQVTGGIIAALIVFKEATMYQVTGDAASTTQPLTLNGMNVTVGTLSPNGIAATPKGLAFIAVDGIRVIDFKGVVSDPVGVAGSGITAPFAAISVPSRAAMACNADTVRVSLQYQGPAGVVPVEYWYTISRACWSGPHSCNCALMQSYSNTFVVTLPSVDANLFQSDSVQNQGSLFVENGTQLTLDWWTAVLPDAQVMAEFNLLEATINFVGATNAAVYTVQAINSDGTALDTITVSLDSGGSVWGSFNWGGGFWSVSVSGLTPRPLNWHYPIVFRKLSMRVTGNSYLGFKIGDMFTRMEQLGYLQMVS
jgi:hypothetical protein